SISGGAGNDSIYGGQENDTVSGGGGNDNVAGDAGNDQVNGGSGNDILYGGAGNDVIDPDTGNDTIFAGNGNDTLTLGDSDTGNKLVYMDKLQDFVNIISTTGDHVVYLGENNDATDLEANSGNIQVFGQDGNDDIWAQNSGSDTLDGGNDNDYVGIGEGSVGDKVLIGGFGDDQHEVEENSGNASSQILPNTHVTVSGGEGADSIGYERGLFITDANDGGSDDDWIYFNQATILTLRDKSLENIETVTFSNSGDYVVFADGNNVKVVNGNDGEDYLSAARETSAGYTLNGDSGYDTLIGGAGNDKLNGGSEQDQLTGGAGSDTFQFADIWNGNSYRDVLTDFTGGSDKATFNGNLFGDVSAIDGYKGTTGVGSSANDNLLIATGQSYSSVGQFDSFLSEGDADNNKPGFYIFFNSDTNRAEMYFDTDMTSTEGAVLIATFNNITAVSQLDKLNEGPTGHNSGDFVIL
ncbi:hemolysin type calcium-binding protein, partial [Stella humosa]